MDGVRDGFGMIQTHYTYCVLYFYYDYPSSTSDHQALDTGSWGPLLKYPPTNFPRGWHPASPLSPWKEGLLCPSPPSHQLQGQSPCG